MNPIAFEQGARLEHEQHRGIFDGLRRKVGATLAVATLLVGGSIISDSIDDSAPVASAAAGDELSPGEKLCFPVAGERGVDYAVVNLTPVRANTPGHGLLYSSDVANPSIASNVNYNVGTVDPNVAIAQIGADGNVCFKNADLRSAGFNNTVDLVADHLGTIKGSAYTPAQASGSPLRKVDTRINQGGDILVPGEKLCFPVAGDPGDYAVANLTPVQATWPGHGLLHPSDVTPSIASSVNYRPGSVDPNVSIAQIGADGKVCFTNSNIEGKNSVHLVADHLGTIDGVAYTPAQASGSPLRKVDTRINQGGDVLTPGEKLCFPVAGERGVDYAVVNLTPVRANTPGHGLLYSSDVANPSIASNVNYNVGTVDPNVAIAQIGADGNVCFKNADLRSAGFNNTVDLVADHLGTIKGSAYTPAQASGSPLRKVDTRIGLGVENGTSNVGKVKPDYVSGDIRFELIANGILMSCGQYIEPGNTQPSTLVEFVLNGLDYAGGERFPKINFDIVSPVFDSVGGFTETFPNGQAVLASGLYGAYDSVSVDKIQVQVWDEASSQPLTHSIYSYDEPLACPRNY